ETPEGRRHLHTARRRHQVRRRPPKGHVARPRPLEAGWALRPEQPRLVRHQDQLRQRPRRHVRRAQVRRGARGAPPGEERRGTLPARP
ncbi:hypothetical protein BN1708_020574, partial [Verticillium longisporum]